MVGRGALDSQILVRFQVSQPIKQNMELKNKAVVITGGTKGLGRELAQAFQSENANVIVCGRNEKEFKNLEKNILAVKADVTKEGDLNNLIKVVKEKYGQVDIWINNAGVWLPHASIEETDWSRVHEMIEVNLFGTIYGSKVALIQMRKQGNGTIINILSTSALEGRAGSSGYGASKFAAMGFTKALRKETEGTEIKVMAIYPGGMQTNFFDEKKPENYVEYMNPSFVAQKIVENIKKNQPEEELIIKRPV